MLTVVLATRDGSSTLSEVLETYRRLEVPSGGWKLVIADNGSVDGTPALLARYAEVLPLTIVEVGKPGKNVALNAAIEHREGDLVVLTDDDAVPRSDWLVRLRAAADAIRDHDVFGGCILPRWPREPEPWHLDWVPHDMTYTLTPPGRTSGPLPATQVPGPNMAVRSSIFDRGHRFDAAIGPMPGRSYVMGSETEFTLRLEQAGHRAWFVSDAVVEHLIRIQQMERSWILKRAVRYGRCIYRRDRQRNEPRPAMAFGMPRWVLRRLATGALRFAAARLTGNHKRAFQQEWQCRFDVGYLSEARREAATSDSRAAE